MMTTTTTTTVMVMVMMMTVMNDDACSPLLSVDSLHTRSWQSTAVPCRQCCGSPGENSLEIKNQTVGEMLTHEL